ncbi:MAG: signal peptidase II [Neisseria sp.]|uniref:signal peptidase II n=1 Tax=Neisseria sp. TaxID=192066 RepID=UPI0026DD9F9E|nr:signal peptidase II [Neisseria sp.]MDO4640732.1 signal peptidase II [Neisseria sp.]
MNKPKLSNTHYWLLAVTAIILDQLSKTAILKFFQEYERVNIIPGFFDLTRVYNTGAAFSFLADAGGWQKFFFIGLAAVICGWLIREIIRNQFGTWGKTGAAMVIGGAIGNVADRLQHGHVIDYLLFYWKDWFYPAFNVADSFIVVGAALLVLDGLRNNKKESAAQKAEHSS